MAKGLAYNVCFFGAKAGDVLVSQKLGIRLVLHGAAVPPCAKVRSTVSESDLLDCLSKESGLGIESCRDELRLVLPPDDHPNHRALGQDCRHSFTKHVCAQARCPVSSTLELVELGELRQYARDAGNLEALEALIGKPVPFWQILALCGKHTLCLRRGLYRTERVAGRFAGSEATTLPIADLRSGPDVPSTLVELPELSVALRLDAAAAALGLAECREVASAGLSPGEVAQVDRAISLLRQATPALLKSLLQKLVRHYGSLDPVVDDVAQGVPKRVLLSCSVALLFQHVGSFVPELQTYVRGVVALLKRAAVVAIEDGYPTDGVIRLTGLTPRDLLLLAAAFKEHKRLHPTAQLGKRVVTFCLGCLDSPRRINWQAMRDRGAAHPPAPPSPEWSSAHKALCFLGAMQGDKDMIRGIAEGGALKFATCEEAKLLRMPFSLSWAIDFHCVRGILHGFSGGSFIDRKMHMFKDFTGVDPRGQRAGYGYDLELMARLRPLQQFCWDRMVGCERTVIPVLGQIHEHMSFDSCPIAYMVGDIAQRIDGRDYIVTLGTRDSLAEEVVIARPSRAARDVLDVPEAVRSKAIDAVRHMRFPLGCPFPTGTQLHFEHGRWVLETADKDTTRVVDADEYCDRPLPVTIGEHVPAKADATSLLDLAACIGSGFRRGWWDEISKQLGTLRSELLDRLLVVLSSVQADGKIEMPVFSLQAGSATSAKDGDEDVFELLLHVAIQCPSALQAQQIPTFKVQNLLHFLFLRRRIKGWVFERRTIPQGVEAQWMRSKGRCLKAEQELALDRLRTTGRRVQFIFAPTGAGKTFTAASFLMTLNVETVLWIAPDEAIHALAEELRKSVNAKIVVFSGRGGSQTDPEPNAINLVRYDHAKSEAVIGKLKAWASRAAIVLDEADKLFGETKRSSAMLELAHISAFVLMMSATVLRSSSNLEPLFAWANLLSDFPTSRKNLFVFFASLVNFQRESVIKQNFVTEYVDMPLTEEYRRAVLSRRWLDAATLVYNALDRELVARAMVLNGPTFLVGRNVDHASALLEQLRLGAKAAGFTEADFGDFEEAAARAAAGRGALRVCVIPLSKHRGYNFGKHYRRMVLPPLASSVATRVQLFGRLTRMDQEFAEVTYSTVVPKRTILELLHDRHTLDDAVQASIEKLGQRFGHLAEAMLQRPASPHRAAAAQLPPPDAQDDRPTASRSAGRCAKRPAAAAAVGARARKEPRSGGRTSV